MIGSSNNTLDIKIETPVKIREHTITTYCPHAGARISGSGNTCPHCLSSLSDISHWKWYNPEEPHPYNND